MSWERERDVALEAAEVAGGIILGHYGKGLSPETKADGSPVTQADLEASAAIERILGDAFPGDAILGEEGPDDPARFGRERVWIVDPLDGTRDFLARTGDFCVHVALAFRGRPVVGVVRHVVPELSAHAVVGQGAWIGQTRLAVSTSASAARVGVSRISCPPPLAAALGERARPSGASVKYLALARGELDGIMTLTPGEKEWDTCAPELVVTEAGGRVTGGDGRALAYNQPDLGRPTGIVASNGLCHDELISLVTRCA